MSTSRTLLTVAPVFATGFALAAVWVHFKGPRHDRDRSEPVREEPVARAEPARPASPRATSTRSVGVSEQLAALDADLDRRWPWTQAFDLPAMWSAEERKELESGLAKIAPFFDGVDALLASPECKAALASESFVAAKAPRVGRTRQRTNALCARTVLDFEHAQDARAAASRLGQALDLIRLDDDVDVVDCIATVANEDVVLLTLQHLVVAQHADPAPLHRELDERLARIAGEDRLTRVATNTAVLGRGRNDLGLIHARRAVSRSALEVAALMKEHADVLPRPEAYEFVEIEETPAEVDVCAKSVLKDFGLRVGDPGTELLCWKLPR